MSKSKRVIVVAESDSHGGHKLGLLSPNTLLPEEEISPDGQLQVEWTSPPLTKTQERLWEIREGAKNKVIDLAGKDDIHVLEVGDLTQGNKYPTELVTTRDGDQTLIAYYNLLEWYNVPNVKTVTYSKGTGSHTFGFSSSEINLCHMFKKEFKNIKSDIAYHWLLDINGVTFDTAHHGPSPGIRHWLKGNNARYYLKDLMYTEFFAGRTPPNVVLRAHFHSYVKELVTMTFQGKDYESWIYVLPPLCIPGDFTIQVIKSVYSVQIGLLAFEVIDGQISKSYKFTQSFDTRAKETL